MLYTIIRWSTAEVNKLIKHYPVSTQEEMENLLPGRSYNSIKQKAKQLHVSKLFRESSFDKLKTNQRKTNTGVVSLRGNVTIHRMR